MGNKYNEQDINRFFENLKNLKNTYDLEKVHCLINNPDAKATQKVKFYYKPLNFIIMTSIIMILVSAVLFWPEPEENNRNGEIEITISSLKTDKEQSSDIVGVNPPQPNMQDLKEKKELRKAKSEEGIAPMPKENKPVKEPVEEMVSENPKVLVEDSVHMCEWPTDTVIDKELLLVKLENDELEKLGIIIDGNSLYYNNRIPKENRSYAGISSSSTIAGDIPEEEKNITNHNFIRLFTSSTNYEPWGTSQNYFSSIDTLVPVVLDSEYHNIIFWFNAHDDLFEVLPERYSYLKDLYNNLICLKRKYPSRYFVNYPFVSVKEGDDAIKYLDLDKEELEKLGIYILENCMVIQSKDLEQTFSSCYYNSKKLEKEDNWIDSLDIVRILEESFPVVATDTFGRLYDFYTNRKYNKHNFSEIKELLIPVKIDCWNLYGRFNDKVWLWWFYPTDEFVNALPERIKHDLKLERDAIINNTPNKSGSCNYFEACKSTLRLDNLSIYPNPVSETVRIDFSLDETIDGRISLVNISGAVLKVIAPQTTFMSGLNSFEANLSDVSPGIYLITINTEHGFKTQRIIVSR